MVVEEGKKLTRLCQCLGVIKERLLRVRAPARARSAISDKPSDLSAEVAASTLPLMADAAAPLLNGSVAP